MCQDDEYLGTLAEDPNMQSNGFSIDSRTSAAALIYIMIKIPANITYEVAYSVLTKQ